MYYSFNPSVYFSILKSQEKLHIHLPISTPSSYYPLLCCIFSKNTSKDLFILSVSISLSCSLMNPLIRFSPQCTELAPSMVNDDLSVNSNVTSQFSSYATHQQFLTHLINHSSRVCPCLLGPIFFLALPAALLATLFSLLLKFLLIWQLLNVGTCQDSVPTLL